MNCRIGLAGHNFQNRLKYDGLFDAAVKLPGLFRSKIIDSDTTLLAFGPAWSKYDLNYIFLCWRAILFRQESIAS
jgi:hypothetical protein